MSFSIKSDESGFTIVELLVVIVIIVVLARFVLSAFDNINDEAYLSRAASEFRSMHIALELYRVENGEYPEDVNRDIPPGIEKYLEKTDADRWPSAPWPGAVYDYDKFTADGVETYQISIRFCDIGNPDSCRFPNIEWAEDFDINSSVYHCIQGNCRPHPNQPADHPGYCVNCQNDSSYKRKPFLATLPL